MILRTRFFLWAASGLLAAACQTQAEDQIQTYTVPKEHPPTATTPSASPDLPVNSSPIQFSTPSGWQEVAPSSVRLASFNIQGQEGGKAEVAVTSFPGQVGTELENVNRWRRELQLPPVQESDLSSQPVSVDSADGRLYDISSDTKKTVVAMVPRNGATWFFKLRGDAATVTGARPAFMQFLQSVRFVANETTAAPPAANSSAAPVDTGVSAGGPKWNLPANWVEKEPGPMIFKSFLVSDSNAKAAVTISFFPGTVGGILANVNRWRGQLGLGPVEDVQLSSVTKLLEAEDGPATLVDFTGASKAGEPARLVAAIVPHGDNTWFYKLIGAPAAVEHEKVSFVNFVKSVHYP